MWQRDSDERYQRLPDLPLSALQGRPTSRRSEIVVAVGSLTPSIAD